MWIAFDVNETFDEILNFLLQPTNELGRSFRPFRYKQQNFFKFYWSLVSRQVKLISGRYLRQINFALSEKYSERNTGGGQQPTLHTTQWKHELKNIIVDYILEKSTTATEDFI